MPLGALEGVLVADFSRVLAGPIATMLLGDLGADVVKVERPGGGDDTREWGPPWVDRGATYYLGLNRNKRSITLDLHAAEDLDLARRLAARADVVIESFRPGTMDRLGLGREAVAKANPGAITCSVSAFGPDSTLAGYDLLLQAAGGLMSLTGEADGPPLKVGAPVVDLICGLHATIGILAALHARAADPEGRGQHVDVTLMEAALSSLVNQASAFLLAGVVGHRNGNIHPSIAVYQPFEASDGPFVVAAANDALWRSVCDVIDRPELADDERFADNGRRREHVEELRKLLDEAFSRRPAEEWIALLQEAGVPAGPINDVGEAFAMATELGLDPIVDIDGLRLLRPPVRLSRTPATVRLPPPALGEHDDELRAWLSS